MPVTQQTNLVKKISKIRKRSTERRIQDIADQSEENDKVMTENASHPANKSGKENLQDKKTSKKKTADEFVPPSQKVYPHHNSAKDIQEARKRYLQRKIEREKNLHWLNLLLKFVK